MVRKMLLAVVVALALLPVVGVAAAAPSGGPLAVPGADTVVLGTLGAELTAQDYQTATPVTVPTLDTGEIMDSVNEGVGYGFQFAGAFSPLITIIIGFSVAGAIIGLLFALGPRVAKMIKNAL
ncbi:MAG: hypothetical protein JXB47_03975 [Anaerolineae bacterium]|nr:hypothetical protein [Anaerolineae bacterium]